MKKLSVAILTYNNENTITATLHSIKEEADEIIIIDGGSSDATCEIASNFFQAKVTVVDNLLDFARKRNLALAQAQNDWVFFIDSDERLDFKAQESIALWKNDNNQTVMALSISRVDVFLDKKVLYGEVLDARTKGIIRLVNRTSGRFVGKVHEVFETKAKKARLEGEILHYPHDSVTDFLQAINDYSSKRANELINSGKRPSIFTLILLPILKFSYTFFWKRGYLDGERGFIYSFLMALHSFLVRGKMYLQLAGKRDEKDFF